MDDLTLINNTSVYRQPSPLSPLQGPNVMQPAVVYSKIMLRTIELSESDFVFDGLATERTMPSNNGANEITFKRMLSLAAHTQPLVEGIPPASDQGRMVAIKASTKSYGRVMKFTDKVNWAVVDPTISEYTRQLSLKIPETKDILAQESLLSESGSFYAAVKVASSTDPDILVVDSTADAITHIKRLTPSCSPTIDEFRKIVLSMEAAKVRPHMGSNFLALVSSAVMYDLITDKRVKEFMKFANSGEAYKNDVVIDLFSLAFKKAKTIKTDNTYVDGDGNLRYIYHSEVCGSISNTASTGIDPSLTAAYVGEPINVITFKPISEIAAGDKYLVVYLNKTAAAGNTNYEIELTQGTAGTLNTALIANVIGSDYDVLNVHHSFVIGEECLFRIGVEGHSQPQFIKKELGSAGTEDPLNQRQSIGWKIDSLGYKVVNPDAIVDYMSIPTQYKINVRARPDLKNEFTDYYYGYVSAAGDYFYPEQVMQTIVSGAVKYYVKGTTTEVTAVKMSKLVKPINGGRIDSNGQKPVVLGRIPSAKYCLASNHAVLFEIDQVVLHSDGKHYIKGLAGTAAAECIVLPATYTTTVVTADGTGSKSVTAIVDEGGVNDTGDPRID